MLVYLYKDFKKKENSTMLPSGEYDAYNMILKEDSSAYNPTLLIESSSATTNLILYSYAYIPCFYRYYYVEDIRWIDHRKWEISLSTDVLATHREIIGNSTQWVERCASKSAGAVVDNLYPTSVALSFGGQTLSSPFTKDGFYMVSGYQEDGEESSYIGTSTLVCMSKYQLKALSSQLSSKISDIFDSKDVSKMLVDPFQYIESCMFFPLDKDSIGFSLKNNYKLHGVSTTVSYYIKTTSSFSYYKKGWLRFDEGAKHPDAEKYGSYLNGSVGTDIILYVPPFGTISLNADIVRMGDGVRCDITIDLITGASQLDIYSPRVSGDVLLESVSGQVGTSTKLEGTRIDYSSVVGSSTSVVGGLVGSAIGIVSGNIGEVAKGVANSVSSIGSLVKSTTPQYSSVGSSGGGLASIYRQPFIQYSYKRKVGLDVANYGLPYCDAEQINRLSGYIKCANVHLNLSCSIDERHKVVDFMENGFYYE